MTLLLAPRHLQLRDILLRRWKTSGLKVGQRIESQNEIVQLCDFSLITVVKTLKDLEAAGIIRREVGKGSFLRSAPWAENWHRIGFFYNRDVIGGGIFRNPFYTELVMAFEQKVVGDGHSFSMSSSSHAGARLSDVDALDIAVLAGVSDQTKLDFIDQATAQIAVLDQRISHAKLSCFCLDFAPAIIDMVKAMPLGTSFLYLDTLIGSSERGPRLAAAKAAVGAGLQVLAVDPESRDRGGLAQVQAQLAKGQAQVVFGHLPQDWLAEIAQTGARAFPFTMSRDIPGLYVDAEAWMAQVLPSLYASHQDRQAPPVLDLFPAQFRP